jgi:hypothetical protein
MTELVVIEGGVTSPEDMRLKVMQVEAMMLQMPQVEMPVKHHFSQGVYARELHIPKGTILTGKIHKFPQLNILSKGEISVLTEDGIKRVSAPFHVVSPAGTKRIAYAHEDCVWTTIHGTEENDLEKIEAHFIAQSETEYLEFVKMIGEQKCLG